MVIVSLFTLAGNAERLCEVGKIREAEIFFQFCKTVVVRWATVGRTSCSSGAAAPRCTEGERSEPFVQLPNTRNSLTKNESLETQKRRDK